MDNPSPKPVAMPQLDVIMLRVLQATREASAASLAGGVIAASKRSHTVEDAIAVYDEVFGALFPNLARPASRPQRAEISNGGNGAAARN